MSIENNTVLETVRLLPESPGVYEFYDENGKILYIGKAKNLKKRVVSYFQKEAPNGKTALLVKKIRKVEYILVETEIDALLLENNLIKKHQPRYNVLLKDDKTFPWICIKNERFPRIVPTRNRTKDGSEYFGPYASVKMMNALLELIKKIYFLRTCTFSLTEENISKKKFKVCLDYHIGICKGPCEGLQEEEEYQNSISQIKKIIKGNISSVKKELHIMMEKAAEKLEFEKAQLIKEQLALLDKYQSRSTVVSASMNDMDVFGFIAKDGNAYVNYLRVMEGAIVQSHTLELKNKTSETEEELFQMGIAEIKQRYQSEAKEMIVSQELGIEFPGVTALIPKIGEKKKLVELSLRNLKNYIFEKEKKASLTDPERHSKRILQTLQNDLHLKELPVHIECFDNSNFQGSFPVAALTVFKNAKPDKKEYRHYNIRTVQGPNDFASMEEVLYRRYKRLTEENKSLPQLIVVDGGKGQLSAAIKSLEKLNLSGKIAVIGIAKKLEEVYFPGDSTPHYLNKKSESLKLIQQIRDEAHRFGISHHRNQRSKETIKTELTAIKGISNQTAQKLLLKFKSVAVIKNTPAEELSAVVGKKKAAIISAYFSEK